MPEGITIVPPLPHDAIADVIAGTSSVEEDPPALGVHVEARAFSMRVASGRAKVGAVTASRASNFDIDIVGYFAAFDGNYGTHYASNLRFIDICLSPLLVNTHRTEPSFDFLESQSHNARPIYMN